MRGSQDAVAAFHAKFNFKVGANILADNDPKATKDLKVVAETLLENAKRTLAPALRALKDNGDDRLYKAHLIIEEAGEVCEALAARDEVLLADGIADLLYVTIGIGVTYDIPVEECFDEVHRSNMTKARRTKDNPRMRRSKKSKTYSPPNLVKAITQGRETNEQIRNG